MFNPHLKSLEDCFTCYVFDLYYHGKSDWPEHVITHQVIRDTIGAVLVKEKINNFSLLGFSLGGRICISLLSSFPERCQGIFLLAPDGIYRSPWYRLSTHPSSNWLFKYFMWHPSRFDQLINIFDRSGLVDKSLIRFSKKELSTQISRRRVYFTWTNYKPLQIHPEVFKKLLQTSNVICWLYLGSKDEIIHPKSILPLIQPHPNVVVHLLEAKHNHMIQSAIPQIISELTSG